jgi:teichuronic acid exporter
LEFKKRSLIELFSVIVGSFVTLVLALLQHGVWALILGNLSSVFFRAVVVNVVSPFRFIPTLSISGMRALFSFGGNVTASRFLWFFYTQADNVIVGRTLGNEALGFYSVAMHLASLPVQRVSAVLNQVSFPVFSRFQHDIVTVKLQLLKTLSLLSFIAFPILWGISSVSPELVEVVLGKKWQSAVLPLQILSLIMPFRMLVGFLPSITDAIGKPGIALRNVVLGCVVMPLSFYIGSRWGIKGVTLAWVTAYPVVFLINTQRMLAGVQLRVGEGFRAVAKSIFCASLMYLSVVLVRFMLPDGWGVFATFAILVTVGSVSYIATSLAFNVAPFTQMKRLVFAG